MRRSDLTPSIGLWLGDDLERVVLLVTHWRGLDFTGRTFHLTDACPHAAPNDQAEEAI